MTVAFPVKIESASGLQVQVNANGSIRRMDHRDILLNLFPGNEMEGGPTNIYLRRRGASIASIPILGPRSPAVVHVDEQGLTARGQWRGIRFTASLVLAASTPAWFWLVALENTGTATATLDLLYAQDVALAHYGAVRLNEYYVSQYVDHTSLTHPARGVVLAVRQNLAMGGRHPWVVIGSLGRGVSFATDALEFHGLATRAGRAPVGLMAKQLPARRRQHEHAMAVIQDAQVRLAPAGVVHLGFFGWFEEDHPSASSPADLAFVDKASMLPEARLTNEPSAGPPTGMQAATTLFSACPMLTSLDLSEPEITTLFGEDRRLVERDDSGLLSFFTGADRHVVLKSKELSVLRPHGHIVRTGESLTPDEASLTSTMWMAGVFNSMLTQGHVSINRFLSTSRSYLGLLRAHGQRIFVERRNGYALLDLPSAYEMTPNGCRWIYKHPNGLIAVRSWASIARHVLYVCVDVLAGAPCRFLISHHIAWNGDDGAEAVPVQFERDGDGIVIRPAPESDIGRRFPAGSFRIDPGQGTVIERAEGDELLFADGRSRRQPYLTLVTGKAAAVSFHITGCLVPAAGIRETAADLAGEVAAEQERAGRFWRGLSGFTPLLSAPGPLAGDVACLREMLPWFAHNAMIHYLAPRGLEQYSGGGWGVRDVTQGPVEMLISLGQWEPVRDLLLRVYTAQNPDGDWPQWFMFFDRERSIRAGESHGDIVFWPVLALAEYLHAAEDASLLDEVVPFFHPAGHDHAERATLWVHVERALAVIAARVIPGTHLAAYGHGDWNDSLQPADPAMRERLCSAWTVTLHYQTLTALARAMRRLGRPPLATEFEASAARVHADFQRLLIVDETVTGFVYVHPDGRIDYLLHPRDGNTGIRYRLLPMIHAIINDLLTPDQAATHVGYIKQHLLGPDGARLFDRPPPYRGGPQTYFQRAESSTFFGREIGLMYMHAHLRYAEAMARYGDVEAFFLALRQATPIALRSVVPAAAMRQANCYYSSSDAAFADRYEALAHYDKVKSGGVALEGGWRIYSSGAGIAVRLLQQCFLGLRPEKSALCVDPVIPASLDGLQAEGELAGRRARIIYRIGGAGYGPQSVTLNGTELSFARETNPYRTGGVEVPMAEVLERLIAGTNELRVCLG